MPGNSILIPIRGLDEYVEVPTDDLPDDAADILDILKAEFAPLDLWLKFASEYYKQGKSEQAHEILKEGAQINEMINDRTDPSIEAQYADAKSERIAILNALAAYYTQHAVHEKDKRRRDDYFQRATSNYNMADKIDIREQITWVGKGVLLLAKGEFDRASYSFDTALEHNSRNVPALLGKACIYFNKNATDDALKLYKTALQTLPISPAAVRLGLAYCYYRMGNAAKARQCFERVVQLDEDNVEALSALGILDLNMGDPASIQQGLNRLKRAHDRNPNHALTLNQLANHFFYKQEYAKSLALAKQAQSNTDVNQIKAESFYLMGRVFHAQNEFEQAFQMYSQSIRLWPDHILSHYGQGQMYIYKGDTDAAVQSFEKVIVAHPDNRETLKVLGSLYSKTPEKREQAMSHLQRVTELYPDDHEARIELGQLLEQTDQARALKCYEMALQQMEARKERPSPSLLNNIAVLKHVKGDLDIAESLYNRALEAEEGGASSDAPYKKNITTLYNLARLYEEKLQTSKAQTLYKEIIREHPNYLDCYLRLGCIAKVRGHIYEASDCIKLALNIKEDNFDALSLLGNLHLEKDEPRELEEAQKKFKRILQVDKNDSYAILSLANTYCSLARHEAIAHKGNDGRTSEALLKAMDYYNKVLTKEPGNLYAANSVGVLLADKGKIAEAKEVFSMVRECTADMPDVWVNMAHIYLAQGQHINAIKMYQNCLKKFYYNRESSILLFLARAYYDFGKYQECKRVLLKALHLMPDNPALRYNIALAQFMYGTKLLEGKRNNLNELKSAVTELNLARQMFLNLKNSKVGKNPNYDPERAERFAHKCRKAHDEGRRAVFKAEEEERKMEEARDSQRQRLEEEKQKLREAELSKLAAEDERKRLEQQQAEEHERRLKDKMEHWMRSEAARDETEKSKSAKKGKKGKNEEPDFIVNDIEGEGESWEERRDRKNPKAKLMAEKTKEKAQREKEEAIRKRGGGGEGRDSESDSDADEEWLNSLSKDGKGAEGKESSKDITDGDEEESRKKGRGRLRKNREESDNESDKGARASSPSSPTGRSSPPTSTSKRRRIIEEDDEEGVAGQDSQEIPKESVTPSEPMASQEDNENHEAAEQEDRLESRASTPPPLIEETMKKADVREEEEEYEAEEDEDTHMTTTMTTTKVVESEATEEDTDMTTMTTTTKVVASEATEEERTVVPLAQEEEEEEDIMDI